MKLTNMIKGYLTCAIRNRARDIKVKQVVRNPGSQVIRVCLQTTEIGGQILHGEILLSVEEAEDLGDALTRLAIANPQTGITNVNFNKFGVNR